MDTAFDHSAPLPPALAQAQGLLAQLIAQGLRDVVVCPGSRSAPLAYAAYVAAEQGLVRLHVRIDERTAGFLALGVGKGNPERPALVITTSGTAVAHLHPAVLEAHHSNIPLIVVSADRPHELRGTGANQTTTHVGMFGSSVRLVVDIPAPCGRPREAAEVHAGAARAWAAATGVTQQSGPVHVNMAFREPLAPHSDELKHMQRVAAEIPEPVSFGPHRHTTHYVDDALHAHTIAAIKNTVIIAGDNATQAVGDLAQAHGWPIIAEPSSGLVGHEQAIPGAVHILTHTHGRLHALTQSIEQVIVCGHPTLTRAVQRLIAREDVTTVVIAQGTGPWTDPSNSADMVLYGIPQQLVSKQHATDDNQSWLQQWKTHSQKVARLLDDEIGSGDLHTGLAPARAIRATVDVSDNDIVFFGASSAIRDADAYVTRWSDGQQIEAQRGLAGIDGGISGALGLAFATGKRVRAILGDLTFLHDAGGLLRSAKEPIAPVDIIVLNDQGGAIFSGLEHGAAGDFELFERVFGTPHEAHIELLCAAYGVDYQRISTDDELSMLLKSGSDSIRVFEIVFSREERTRAFRRITAGLDALA
ncbi:2-succinyl-5-enolpyruvyl-6-hydroxy-3-cyclohexene-1-carboxylic-acid synthase [Timonella sp. A28]|uniref:2-succinyl-5-enolpyruvyl-6-hydroxy-3- cyclohexene-1-carboxylic-acid synthase n=1 Tax=Timonella sp. A28 TaxID=3442640 RepID=UPI003EBF9BB3